MDKSTTVLVRSMGVAREGGQTRALRYMGLVGVVIVGCALLAGAFLMRPGPEAALAGTGAATAIERTGSDWPQWGGTLSRNMVSPETGLPSSFSPGVEGTRGKWISPPVNLKWAARLGSQTYGTPTVANGKVVIGTNNGSRRNPRLAGDRLVVMCFNEADGKFQWQMASPSPDYHGQFSICTGLGVCTGAAIDEGRAYVVTSRCHVVAMDLEPLGNRKPTYAAEAQYLAAPVHEWFSMGPTGPKVALQPGKPVTLTPTDANIAWVFDMMTKAPSWPHDANGSSVLVEGDFVYAATGNAKAANERTVLCPKGPSVIALDKRTGQLVARDDAGIAAHTFHGQWSSPSYGVVNGRPLLFYGGGDGYCYAFEAKPQLRPDGKPGVLKKVWRCDANTATARQGRYHSPNGVNEIVGTPVFDKNRVYVAAGQDPNHGLGKGCLTCIDATKLGDITKTGVIWRYTGLGRSVSTVAVADGLVYAPDLNGVLHCVDAATGKLVWSQNLGSRVWGSPLVADGKVYIGTTRGQLWVLKAGRKKQVYSTIAMRAPIYTTPVAANGVLYVATNRYLYAMQKQAAVATTAR